MDLATVVGSGSHNRSARRHPFEGERAIRLRPDLHNVFLGGPIRFTAPSNLKIRVSPIHL
jgi:hypothetical protein